MFADTHNYIRHHESVIAPLHKEYSLKFWALSLNGTDASLEKDLVTAKERYLKVYNNREEFRQIREWKSQTAGLDEIAARQLKLIHDAFVPNQIPEHVLRDIVERETHIENLFNTFRQRM